MLTVKVKTSNNEAILHCQGRIVSGDEHTLLCAALEQRGRKITLDLSRVEAIDAAGIGALVSLQAAGIYLKLLNPTSHVRETLKLTKLDTIFEICEAPLLSESDSVLAQLPDHDCGAHHLPAAV
jgi:anti-anti-sigma factor